MEDEEDGEVTIGRPAIVEVLCGGGRDDNEVPEAGSEVDDNDAREDEEDEERSDDASDARDVVAGSKDAEDETGEEMRPKLTEVDEEIEEDDETDDEDVRPDEDADIVDTEIGGEVMALAVVEDVNDGDAACEGVCEVGDVSIDELADPSWLNRL